MQLTQWLDNTPVYIAVDSIECWCVATLGGQPYTHVQLRTSHVKVAETVEQIKEKIQNE